MAKKAATQAVEPATPPKSLAIFSRGVETGSDFARAMSALMTDLATGQITPQAGNAIVNAGGKLLKVVEMQQRYGVQGNGQRKVLKLTGETE